MLKEGMALQLILKITGLPSETIKQTHELWEQNPEITIDECYSQIKK